MAQRANAAYQTLAQELTASILQGKYPPPNPLPTEADLVQQTGLSRQTIRRAFQELQSAGMVTRIPGRGTFARTPERDSLRHFGSIEELMGLSADTNLELLVPLHEQVDVIAASRLRTDSDVVTAVRFVRRRQGRPALVTDASFPTDVGALLSDVPELCAPGEMSRVTIIGLLDGRLAHPITEADQSITAVLADPETATALECEPGAPLLRIDRVYYTADGRAVELAISHSLPELHSYRVRLQRNRP